MDEVVSLSQAELTKVLRNCGTRRTISLHGARLNVRLANIIGVYYHRAPKAMVRIRGVMKQ